MTGLQPSLLAGSPSAYGLGSQNGTIDQNRLRNNQVYERASRSNASLDHMSTNVLSEYQDVASHGHSNFHLQQRHPPKN